MPVDPGNLLLVGHRGDVPMLGLPGCARSPAPNGFDWVLERLYAGLPVGKAEIMRMGVGGLLKEIASRPMPRADEKAAKAEPAVARAPKIAALVLAAGQSRRMGPVNKLLADVDGRPMVANVVDAALASKASPIVVVLGHQEDRVRTALSGRTVTTVVNPDYAGGLSTSLQRGIAALPADVDGAVVCLGDMPAVSAAVIDRLIAAFDPVEGRLICVPTYNGKRGNPVLWDRRYFAEMTGIAGDVGARHLIGAHDEAVCEVAMGDPGVLLDLDTPEALAAHLARRGEEA
jgi:molybdenum cofactor cytidylyltransferase